MTKRIEQAGVIGVDAGCVMVGDPCYFFGSGGKPSSSQDAYPNWEDVCKQIDYDEDGGRKPTQLKYAMGHDGLGVIVETTHGDGMFRVWVETDEDGHRRLVVDLDGVYPW